MALLALLNFALWRERLPKILYRLWLVVFFAAIVSIVAAFCVRITYGFTLLGSFINGEGSIGFLMRQGFGFEAALGIAIGCSNFDTSGWFLLFSWLRTVNPETIEHRWRSNLYLGLRWFGRKLGHVYVPDPARAGIDFRRQSPNRRCYRFLWLFGIYPGLIQVGVNFALNFKLKPLRAFLTLASANVVKMVFFAVLNFELGVRMNPILPVLLFLVAAHRFKNRVERKIAAWGADVQPQSLPAIPKLDFDEEA